VRQFVGRQTELAALARLLGADRRTQGAAMVISGMAGVGKTALAVHWAHQVAEWFPDGQLYVNLCGYDTDQPMSAGDALGGFLRALGVTGQQIPAGANERAALYRSLLAERRILVVLDNARNSGQVRPLLPGNPACVTVVTSRRALSGLVAREGAVRLAVDPLPQPVAVDLLRKLIGNRADKEPDAAVTLASQCGRLPLALRVVAERAAVRPGVALADLASELAYLRHRLDMLAAGGDERTAMRAVLSWSYRLLDPGAARAFRMAGLAPGPDFDSYAIAALIGTTLAQASQQLERLARAHLVQPAGRDRYSLHDLLRGYARELADAHDGAPEQRAALTNLFDYYLHSAASAMDVAFPAERHRRPRVPPPAVTPAHAFAAAPDALAWLNAELHTLVRVANHTAEHGWPGHATRLGATLFRYLDTAGHFPEAIAIHSQARHAARRISDQAAEADALIGLGLVHGHRGRHQHATSYFQRAMVRYCQVGDEAGQARALNYLGLVQCQQGRYRQAAREYHRASALFHTAGERIGEAYALSNLGMVALRQGRYQQAADHQYQAVALLRANGDWHGEATVLERLGLICLRRGCYQQAASQLRRALSRFRSINDRQGMAGTLTKLGVVDLRQGRHTEAASQLRQALAHYRRMGDPSGQAAALNGLGEVFLATERPADACAKYTAAIDLAAQAGERYEQAHAHDGLATACQASGDPDGARRHRQQALTIYTYLGAPEASQPRAQDPAVSG